MLGKIILYNQEPQNSIGNHEGPLSWSFGASGFWSYGVYGFSGLGLYWLLSRRRADCVMPQGQQQCGAATIGAYQSGSTFFLQGGL